MLSIVIVATTAILPAAVAAHPVCGSHGRYLNTGSGFTPCDVAAMLRGYSYQKLETTSPYDDLAQLGLTGYPAPNTNQADDLVCNPVLYNLVSGCALCQGSTYTWVSWEEWSRHCERISGIGYIANAALSGGLAEIPSWAFIPPSATNNIFSKAAVLAETNSNTVDTSFKKEEIASMFGCKSQTAPIVGGVIGGVGGLLFLGLLLFLFQRKRNSRGQLPKPVGRVASLTSGHSEDTVSREKAAIASHMT